MRVNGFKAMCFFNDFIHAHKWIKKWRLYSYITKWEKKPHQFPKIVRRLNEIMCIQCQAVFGYSHFN